MIPEPAPGPSPDQQRAAGELAQHAFETAGKLRLLAGHMHSLGWRTDEYSVEDLERVADSLGGMSIRAAMSSDDAGIVSMVMGKPMKRIAPNFHIGLGDEQAGA
ncbi:hypothetical protein ACTMTF_45005 [Nonomuraea sp. ZG12]|uniref:hypothetical protein n=1 Tax=Nonomuraea sp. ZG12 TaxID=3452207 RepID=UPI003F8874D7